MEMLRTGAKYAAVLRHLVKTRPQSSRCLSTDQVGQFKIHGLCGAPCTPLKENGDVNFGVIDQYVDHFVAFGVPNAYVTGTTGEGNSLTVAERKGVAEAWVKHGKGRLAAVMIHIGAGNIRDSQELACHAQKIGADAIACVGPTYYKPQSLEQYVSYMREVAAAAPATPFFLYDIDFVTGIPLRADDFFRLAAGSISTLRGLKHTTADLVGMSNIHVDHKGQFQVLMGTDEIYLAGLAMGLDTTIMNSYMGHVLNRVKRSFDNGDLDTARLEQRRAISLNYLRRKYGFGLVGGSKAILRAIGLNVGNPRTPLSPISPATVDELKKDMEEIGFFEWGTNP